MCGYLVKNTKNENSHRGVPSIFLLHFKSPESLVYFYRSLVRSRRGTVPGRWKSLWCICGITARAALFWASVLWPGTSELECRTEAKFIFDIAWKWYPCTFLMHLSDLFLTLYCVAPKQYQLIILSVSFVFFCFFFLFTDPPCETWKDPCDPNPCGNGGMCSEGPAGFICHCPDGFAGVRCHIDCTQPACVEERNCTAGRHVRASNEHDVS